MSFPAHIIATSYPLAFSAYSHFSSIIMDINNHIISRQEVPSFTIVFSGIRDSTLI
jgi:hypothetical protein